MYINIYIYIYYLQWEYVWEYQAGWVHHKLRENWAQAEYVIFVARLKFEEIWP